MARRGSALSSRDDDRTAQAASADYYDKYATHQVEVGINERHRSIQRWLRRFGLVPGLDVLEIGCGVGTQTALIAEALGGSGTLVAVDLSPRSVELARRRLNRWQNVEVIAADVLELELPRRFDVVVMPDVIEHIPLELHDRLFANVRRWLNDDGWTLIHMPNPFFLEWCHQNRPDLLQLIDQPIHTRALAASTEPNGLFIHYLRIYSIWVPEGDFQVIVLRPRRPDPEFHLDATPTLRSRIVMAGRRAVDLAKTRRRTLTMSRGGR